MTQREKVDISVCIVNWNTRDLLVDCINSIYEHAENLNIEIIVVDNASSDSTSEVISKEFGNVILIKNKINVGFSKGINQAITISQGLFTLILNPDIKLVEPCLKKMIEYLENNQEAGCVGCKLINLDGSIQRSYHQNFPSLVREFREGFLINKLWGNRTNNMHIENETIEIEWLVGACIMFKKDVLLELNGFDERYYMYGEDVDICFRLRKRGFKIFYMGDTSMFHYHAASSIKKRKTYFAALLQRESIYRFFKANYNLLNAFGYRFISMMSGLFRVLILLPVTMIAIIIKSDFTKNLINGLEKHIRIIFWSFGLESWTRKQIPD